MTARRRADRACSETYGTWHWVMSIQWSTPDGTVSSGTFYKTLSFGPGHTRSQAFAEILGWITQRHTGGVTPTVLFFSLEPDAL